MAYLSLQNLVKKFQARGGSGEVLAVDNISLDIERGEFVTLLGPSGCGKTTLLRLIAGLEPGRSDVSLRCTDDLPLAGRSAYMAQQDLLLPWLPVIDKDGKVIGKAPREVCKKDKSLIYPVVRLHIFNPQKQIFLQKRTMNTSIQPGKYDAAVAGHVRFGETVEDAVRREAREELNLSGFDFFQVDRTMFYGETTTAMMFIFVAVVDGEIKPDAKETAGGGFFDFKTARRQIGEENLSAGLKEEWPLLVKIYNNMKIKKHNK